ncbi:MAG: hypothetical protein R3E53_06350 [Myxococcota bacterium]
MNRRTRREGSSGLRLALACAMALAIGAPIAGDAGRALAESAPEAPAPEVPAQPVEPVEYDVVFDVGIVPSEKSAHVRIDLSPAGGKVVRWIRFSFDPLRYRAIEASGKLWRGRGIGMLWTLPERGGFSATSSTSTICAATDLRLRCEEVGGSCAGEDPRAAHADQHGGRCDLEVGAASAPAGGMERGRALRVRRARSLRPRQRAHELRSARRLVRLRQARRAAGKRIWDADRVGGRAGGGRASGGWTCRRCLGGRCPP